MVVDNVITYIFPILLETTTSFHVFFGKKLHIGCWKPEEGKLPSRRRLAKAVRKLRSRVRKEPKTFVKWKPNAMTAHRFQKHFRNKIRSVNTAENYLSYDDPRMQLTLFKLQQVVEQNGVPWALVLG